MASNVFLSYSRIDVRSAIEIQTALERAGISCFRDESNLDSRTSFPEQIGEEIQHCSAVIVVLSSNVTESKWVEAEVQQMVSTVPDR